MAGEAHDADRTMHEAGQSLAVNRAGGRRRQSIGKGSAELKMRHFGKKIRNIVLALLGVVFAAGAIGLVIDGIGFTGVMVAFGVAMLATLILSNYPRMKVPKRADLKTADVGGLVAQTELWLEAQRAALPAPAQKIIDEIGIQLDALGMQLREVDQTHPTAVKIRKLIGSDLPEMIDGYDKIPENLRYEERAGATPTNQLVQGLGLISTEIDSVTRQLANGALDDLAIRTRYLDYKYGAGDLAGSDGEHSAARSETKAAPATADNMPDNSSGVPLDFDKSSSKSSVKARRS